jgi:MoaA/NifB/PqqE/SkfB family radical SAM enzyme
MRIKNPFRSLLRILVLRAPIEAQLIVTRRCNLSCGYCTEFDNFSASIPFELLKERIDALHRLRVANIALLGGEPLLHPKIDEVVAYANREAQVSVTTNGFLLSDKVIARLNAAGLSNMQVSIDALYADSSGYIQKSMKSLAPKLERLQRLAKFDVHVTIVLCEDSKDHFKATLHELSQFGFFVSVNLVHNDRGMVEISGPEYLELWEHHYQKGTPFSFIEYEYGRQLLQGQRPKWKCRAGARFFYVDEFGNVQFCSAQRGRLNKPVTQYSGEDVQRHSCTYKGCEEGCSLFCAYRDSQVDNAPFSAIKAMGQALRHGALFHSRHENLIAPAPISISRSRTREVEPV